MYVRRVLTAAVLSSLSSMAIADTVYVSNSANDGGDTYRAAIAAANTDPAIDTIEFDASLSITLDNEIEAYVGTQALTLIGNDSTITGNCDAAPTWDGGLFTAYSAADIDIRGLSFVDSCNNGVGIFLPEDASGTVNVSLTDVSITGARFHGLFVDGQDSGDSYNTDDIPHPDCEDPHPVDSKASINLTVEYSEINGNGTTGDDWLFEIASDAVCIEDDGDFFPSALTGCPADFDGIRVDDGGNGGITAYISHSTANDNLADGVEYDERANGAIESWAYELAVTGNGETEAFELDNTCDSGEVISDLDDGFDIDEEGNGGLFAWFGEIDVSNNRDEGLDLDEADKGSAILIVEGATTNANEDQGIKLDESGNGSLYAQINDTVSNDSDSQHGMEFTEEDRGSLEVTVSNSEVTGNDDSAIAGEQQAPGSGLLTVIDSDVSGNGDPSFDEIDPDEITVVEVGATTSD